MLLDDFHEVMEEEEPMHLIQRHAAVVHRWHAVPPAGLFGFVCEAWQVLQYTCKIRYSLRISFHLLTPPKCCRVIISLPRDLWQIGYHALFCDRDAERQVLCLC